MNAIIVSWAHLAMGTDITATITVIIILRNSTVTVVEAAICLLLHIGIKTRGVTLADQAIGTTAGVVVVDAALVLAPLLILSTSAIALDDFKGLFV